MDILPETQIILKEVAWDLGFRWGMHGSMPHLMDAIADAIIDERLSKRLLQEKLEHPSNKKRKCIKSISMDVKQTTLKTLKEVAWDLGFIWSKHGSMPHLMDAIAVAIKRDRLIKEFKEALEYPNKKAFVESTTEPRLELFNAAKT